MVNFLGNLSGPYFCSLIFLTSSIHFILILDCSRLSYHIPPPIPAQTDQKIIQLRDGRENLGIPIILNAGFFHCFLTLGLSIGILFVLVTGLTSSGALSVISGLVKIYGFEM